MEEMNFPDALRFVMDGKRVSRTAWGNPDIFVYIFDGFLCIHNESGVHRLLVSSGDIFATDWMVVSNNGGPVNSNPC